MKYKNSYIFIFLEVFINIHKLKIFILPLVVLGNFLINKQPYDFK